MTKGMSLHIGLNKVDPHHYEGWSGELVACEADANDMEAIARKKDFAPTKLLTAKATRHAVLQALADAAAKLAKGDILLLSYSGHGGQVPDRNGDEQDGKDETWCLYDGQLIDDELYAALGKLKAGVRVFMLSDSCHSGSVAREMYYRAKPASVVDGGSVRMRAMPRDVALRVYQAHRRFYDDLQKSVPAKAASAEAIGAAVILISGCQDNQTSQDGEFNGLFTSRLLEVWHDGAFEKPYPRFHRAIVALMPPDQTPNYFVCGATDKAFAKQVPFTV